MGKKGELGSIVSIICVPQLQIFSVSTVTAITYCLSLD